jgi:HAD superfamily hydrolase (TIGR01509 family)
MRGGQKDGQQNSGSLHAGHYTRYAWLPAAVAQESTSMPRAVIFDLDGVLIDSEELHYRANSAVLADFGVEIDRRTYGLEFIATGQGPEYAARTFDLPIDPAEIRRRKRPIYDRLLREEVALMPGAAAAVARMAAEFSVALATNSPGRDARFVLERFNLGTCFTAVVAREDYKSGKPAPDAYLTAAARTGVAPGRCLAVEDAEKGVRAAHAAGIACVAVPHPLTAENDFRLAAARIGHLDELTANLVRRFI